MLISSSVTTVDDQVRIGACYSAFAIDDTYGEYTYVVCANAAEEEALRQLIAAGEAAGLVDVNHAAVMRQMLNHVGFWPIESDLMVVFVDTEWRIPADRLHADEQRFLDLLLDFQRPRRTDWRLFDNAPPSGSTHYGIGGPTMCY